LKRGKEFKRVTYRSTQIEKEKDPPGSPEGRGHILIDYPRRKEQKRKMIQVMTPRPLSTQGKRGRRKLKCSLFPREIPQIVQLRKKFYLL